MRILISGAAGYLGCVIAERLLAAGHRVTALDNLERGGDGLRGVCHHEGFDFIRGDCRDPIGLRAFDAIIPMAGIVGLKACDRRPRDAWDINHKAVATFAKSKSKDQLLVYPMTNSGYGTRTGETHCTEDTPLEPVSIYGQSKVAAEKAVLDAENTVSLRLATVFGVSPAMRWDLLVNDFTRRAVQDRCLVLFEGHFRRNFVHVRDVADCFAWVLSGVKILGIDFDDRVFNLGNDACNMSKHQLARKVAEHVPGTTILTADSATDPDKRDYLVSNDRLRRAGFEARRGLDDGIAEVRKAVNLL